MLATLLPLPEASAVNSYTDTACEGQDYRKPAGSLAFTVSGTQYIKVQTFEDQIAENDETVRLELHDPETGAWIQRYGIWVRPESLMPQTLSFRGTIRDGANAASQCGAKRAGTTWYDC